MTDLKLREPGLKDLGHSIRTSVSVLILFSIILGLAYPFTVMGLGQLLFPWRANGSLIAYKGTGIAQQSTAEQSEKPTLIGSELIGQNFSDPKYFWGRLSSTSPYPYNAKNSSGSNLSVLNPELVKKAKERMERIIAFNDFNVSNVSYDSIQRNKIPNNGILNNKIPIELLTSSGSGLDPEISPKAALYQVSRIAQLRKIPESTLIEMISKKTKKRFLGILGEPRLNVLELNLLLDNIEIFKVES